MFCALFPEHDEQQESGFIYRDVVRGIGKVNYYLQKNRRNIVGIGHAVVYFNKLAPLGKPGGGFG